MDLICVGFRVQGLGFGLYPSAISCTETCSGFPLRFISFTHTRPADKRTRHTRLHTHTRHANELLHTHTHTGHANKRRHAKTERHTCVCWTDTRECVRHMKTHRCRAHPSAMSWTESNRGFPLRFISFTCSVSWVWGRCRAKMEQLNRF